MRHFLYIIYYRRRHFSIWLLPARFAPSGDADDLRGAIYGFSSMKGLQHPWGTRRK